jgi:HpcH/HpaI aldolase/citrate lyase family
VNYQETINDNMLVVVMIETMEGVINANEIAAPYGIDVMIEGNNDLSRFSGFNQTDDRYQDLRIRVHDAALRNGVFYGSAGATYLTNDILSADVRFVQNGPALDGWTVPARGRSGAEEPTYGMPCGPANAPAGGGRRCGGAGRGTP